MRNLPKQLETISNFQALDEAFMQYALQRLNEFLPEHSKNSDFLTLQMVLEDNSLNQLYEPLLINGITLDIKKGEDDAEIKAKVDIFLRKLSAKKINGMQIETKKEIVQEVMPSQIEAITSLDDIEKQVEKILENHLTEFDEQTINRYFNSFNSAYQKCLKNSEIEYVELEINRDNYASCQEDIGYNIFYLISATAGLEPWKHLLYEKLKAYFGPSWINSIFFINDIIQLVNVITDYNEKLSQEEKNKQTLLIPTLEKFLNKKAILINEIENFINDIDTDQLQSTNLGKKALNKLNKIIQSKNIDVSGNNMKMYNTNPTKIIEYIKAGSDFKDACKLAFKEKEDREILTKLFGSNLFYKQNANQEAREFDNIIKDSNLHNQGNSNIALENTPYDSKYSKQKIKISIGGMCSNFSLLDVFSIVAKGLTNYQLDKSKPPISAKKAREYLILLIKGIPFEKAINEIIK